MTKRTLNEWILFGNTGTSSKVIWGVATDTINETNINRHLFRLDTPFDIEDFGRCYWLVERYNISKEVLQRVADLIPAWSPIIAKWDTLSRLYLENKALALRDVLTDCRLQK